MDRSIDDSQESMNESQALIAVPSLRFVFSFLFLSLPPPPQPDFIILMDLLRLQTLLPWGPLSSRLARHKTEKQFTKKSFQSS